MAMFFIGANEFLGDTGTDLDPGFRLGTIIGGRVNPRLSINGELTLDALNFDRDIPNVERSFALIDLTFSPLLHLPAGAFELVAGPKLGFWAGGGTVNDHTTGLTTTRRANGLAVGLNVGAFATVSPTMQIGGLFGFVLRKFSTACVKDEGFAEACASDDQLPDAYKVLGFTGALLF
jgi:hypothetical protein